MAIILLDPPSSLNDLLYASEEEYNNHNIRLKPFYNQTDNIISQILEELNLKFVKLDYKTKYTSIIVYKNVEFSISWHWCIFNKKRNFFVEVLGYNCNTFKFKTINDFRNGIINFMEKEISSNDTSVHPIDTVF